MAVDMFLKLAGIKGESTHVKHRDEIDVLSFSFGINRAGGGAAGGGGASGKAQIQDFRIVHNLDTASPDFFDSICSGKVIDNGVFSVAHAGKEVTDYYKITFESVLISSVSPASTGDVPLEQVSLNFASFKVEARRQRPDGSFGPWESTSCDLAGDKTT
jgi:type VI secretion system secreted protein Hcp